MQRTDDDVRSAAACRSLGTWKYDLVELCDTTIGSCDTTIGSYDGWTRQTAETVDYRRSHSSECRTRLVVTVNVWTCSMCAN